MSCLVGEFEAEWQVRDLESEILAGLKRKMRFPERPLCFSAVAFSEHTRLIPASYRKITGALPLRAAAGKKGGPQRRRRVREREGRRELVHVRELVDLPVER